MEDLEDPEDAELEELPEDELDEPRLLDLPPMPPGWEEVERLVMEPEELEVFGVTVEPTTGLFWNVPLEYVFGL